MSGNVRVSTENMDILRGVKRDTGGSIEFLVNKAVAAEYVKAEKKEVKTVPAIKARGPVAESDDNLRAAQWLFETLLHERPTFKRPNINTWAKDVRLMRDQDGRSLEDIYELWIWVRADHFWNPNIQSPSKLRKQFDSIWSKMHNKGTLDEKPRSKSLAERSEDGAREMLADFAEEAADDVVLVADGRPLWLQVD